MFKKILFLLVALVFLCLPSPAKAAQKPIEIYINQKKVISDVAPIILNGYTMVPLRVISENLGANVYWSDADRTVKITTSSREILLKINSDKALVDGREVTLEMPARIVNNRAMVPIRFVSEALGAEVYWDNNTRRVNIYYRPQPTNPPDENDSRLENIDIQEENGNLSITLTTTKPSRYNYFLLSNPARLVLDISDAVLGTSSPAVPENKYIRSIRLGQFTVNPNTVRVVFDLTAAINYQVYQQDNNIKVVIYKSTAQNRLIVIDPGHGGSDPGAVAGGVKEKDFNLDISLKLKKILEDAGARVIMTRDKDIYVGLYPRADIANEAKADVFICIHNNAGDPSASGTETLYYPDPEKKRLAENIQKELVKSIGLPDRGVVARPGLVVTRETKMPSALVEVAFLTNPGDREKLLSDEFRQKAAQGIANGILAFLRGD